MITNKKAGGTNCKTDHYCFLPYNTQHILRGTVIKFVGCGFNTSYYKVFTYTYTDPHSHCWPLCKSANIGIAPENIAETYWQEIPIRRLLWH
jgi:hypothetical protein